MRNYEKSHPPDGLELREGGKRVLGVVLGSGDTS